MLREPCQTPWAIAHICPVILKNCRYFLSEEHRPDWERETGALLLFLFKVDVWKQRQVYLSNKSTLELYRKEKHPPPPPPPPPTPLHLLTMVHNNPPSEMYKEALLLSFSKVDVCERRQVHLSTETTLKLYLNLSTMVHKNPSSEMYKVLLFFSRLESGNGSRSNCRPKTATQHRQPYS